MAVPARLIPVIPADKADDGYLQPEETAAQCPAARFHVMNDP
jgi:hypothetical protein